MVPSRWQLVYLSPEDFNKFLSEGKPAIRLPDDFRMWFAENIHGGYASGTAPSGSAANAVILKD